MDRNLDGKPRLIVHRDRTEIVSALDVPIELVEIQRYLIEMLRAQEEYRFITMVR